MVALQGTAERPLATPATGARLDGRGTEEFRDGISLMPGAVPGAAGSSYVEFGTTKIIVAVHGPHETEARLANSSRGHINCTVTFTSFATSKHSPGGQADLARSYAAMLQSSCTAAAICTSFPKAIVDVHCLVVESGGSDLAVAVCAASVALADAGIPMYDLMAASAVSRVEGQLLLDPTNEEASREDGSLMLALLPSRNMVTELALRGQWQKQELTEVVELAMGGCMQADQVIRESLGSSMVS